MDRFAVYRDISPTYVLCDRRTDSVVALFVNLGDAERTARRLNDRPPPATVCGVPQVQFFWRGQYHGEFIEQRGGGLVEFRGGGRNFVAKLPRNSAPGYGSASVLPPYSPVAL
jgi:hypothetical protein